MCVFFLVFFTSWGIGKFCWFRDLRRIWMTQGDLWSQPRSFTRKDYKFIYTFYISRLTFVINMIPERAFKQTWFTLLKSIEHLLYWSILNRRHTWWFYKPIAANLIAAERLGDFFCQRQCGTSALTSGSIEWLLKIVWTNVNKIMLCYV